MKKEDVPQQGGLNDGCREISYAVDNRGHYSLEQSEGWEAKNIALRQAWEAIDAQLRVVLAEIRAGKRSPLAYHMCKAQMDSSLLAQYAGLARWRVKRHLKPGPFARLNQITLQQYADLFAISVATLCRVPDAPDLQFCAAAAKEEDQ